VFDVHDNQQVRRLDLLRLLRKLARRGVRRVARQALPDGVVNLLDLVEERIPVGREDMLCAPERQVAIRPQGTCRELIAQMGIDPGQAVAETTAAYRPAGPSHSSNGLRNI
jgi:hypothetical protein